MYKSWQQILNSFSYYAVTITIEWKSNMYLIRSDYVLKQDSSED